MLSELLDITDCKHKYFFSGKGGFQRLTNHSFQSASDIVFDLPEPVSAKELLFPTYTANLVVSQF